MIIFTHGASAVLATVGASKLTKQKQLPGKWTLVRNFSFGILPDIPLTLLVLSGKFDPAVHYHHRWITHTPIFWLVVSGIVMLFFSKKIGASLLMATWLHLAMDWYGGADGIPFLFPFSSKQYGVALTGLNGPGGFDLYIKNPLFLALEILINGTFLAFLLSPLIKKLMIKSK
jgi:membrane-bound metal-dependent hydrolase YbcI (DUF457 family)